MWSAIFLTLSFLSLHMLLFLCVQFELKKSRQLTKSPVISWVSMRNRCISRNRGRIGFMSTTAIAIHKKIDKTPLTQRNGRNLRLNPPPVTSNWNTMYFLLSLEFESKMNFACHSFLLFSSHMANFSLKPRCFSNINDVCEHISALALIRFTWVLSYAVGR